MNKLCYRELMEKIIGCFIGIAIGDSLGMPIEFLSKEVIAQRFGRRIETYQSPHEHRWFSHKKPGDTTDDYHFSGPVIAESLIAKNGIDLQDIAERHAASYPNLRIIGSGDATRIALRKLSKGCHWSVSGKDGAEGNGVVMKVAPVAMMCAPEIYSKYNLQGYRYVRLKKEIEEGIIQLAGITHNSKIARLTALMHVAAVVACAMNEEDPEDFDACFKNSVLETCKLGSKLLGIDYENSDSLFNQFLFLFKNKSYEHMSVEEYAAYLGTDKGHAVYTLKFCYGAFLRNPSSIETLYDVVNIIGDSDSNGAIVGAMLGARNGYRIFPEHLICGLRKMDAIMDLSGRFCQTFIK